MPFDPHSDTDLHQILTRTRTIALVGASANPERNSYGVMAYLLGQGYVVHPINPGLAGQQLLGQTVYATLAEVPGPVDMIDIFRNSEAAGGVVDDALQERERLNLSSIWMQLNVINEAAAARAQAQGVEVVMDRCLKIEINRLGLTA